MHRCTKCWDCCYCKLSGIVNTGTGQPDRRKTNTTRDFRSVRCKRLGWLLLVSPRRRAKANVPLAFRQRTMSCRSGRGVLAGHRSRILGWRFQPKKAKAATANRAQQAPSPSVAVRQRTAFRSSLALATAIARALRSECFINRYSTNSVQNLVRFSGQSDPTCCRNIRRSTAIRTGCPTYINKT